MEEEILELFKESNSIIRSFNSVIERKGKTTNWKALEVKDKKVNARRNESPPCAIWHILYMILDKCS